MRLLRAFSGLGLALVTASSALAQTEPLPEIPLTTVIEDGAAELDANAAIEAANEALDAAAAAGEDPVAAAERETLEAIEASISLSAERVAALKREIEDMKGDRARQSAELIAAAQRVKAAEADIAAMEARLGDLIVAELEVRGRLDGAAGTISGVLAALERISRNPPRADRRSGDALGSARSAILISAIVPQLQQKADELMGDLTRLSDIKAAALEEEARLRANFAILEEEQLRIATLIAARKASEDRASAELIAEEEAAAALAARATDLKQLIDELQKRAQAVAVAAEATAAANAGGTAPKLDSETIRLALANTQRAQPAVPFAPARGYLPLPSRAVHVIEYAASDGFGGISEGLRSSPAPGDGRRPRRRLGALPRRLPQLWPNRHLECRAGLHDPACRARQVTVDIGQFVLMGEPVGTMGSRTIGQTVTTSAGAARPPSILRCEGTTSPSTRPDGGLPSKRRPRVDKTSMRLTPSAPPSSRLPSALWPCRSRSTRLRSRRRTRPP